MIRATKVQIEEFQKSMLWADILEEIAKWKEQAGAEYDDIVASAEHENPTSAKVLLHLGHIAGRRSTVEFFEGILDMFLSFKETEQINKTDRA